MDKESDFIKLMKLFIRVVEASKNTAAANDDRLLDAEALALKFFGHVSAAYYLYQGTQLAVLNANFVDASSVNVLGRAALETFLVFYHVFIAPTSEAEKDFIYKSWLLAGFLERQTYPVQSPQGKEMLLKEARLIPPLQAELRENYCFKALTRKQQKRLLENGSWKLPSWTEMALSAGLSRTHAEAFYSYLCGYAHAGNLSTLQIRKAPTLQSQRALCGATVGVLIVSIANMIKAYCTVFPRSQQCSKRIKRGPGWLKCG
jgi:hypothetical protein